MTDKTSPEYLAYKGEAGVRVMSESLADRIIGWTEGYADGCLPETWDSTDATWAGFMDEIRELEAERDRLKLTLADAIRRPLGVIPDSAEGLVNQKDLDDAEIRRK